MWLLMAIAFNLFGLFVTRNLKKPVGTFITAASLILAGKAYIDGPLYRITVEPG
ncbi:MAG: hypothetical protein AB1497_11865 [Bacillota bacterium]